MSRMSPLCLLMVASLNDVIVFKKSFFKDSILPY